MVPLPPYRVGNRFHSIVGQFKVGSGWVVVPILATLITLLFLGGGGREGGYGQQGVGTQYARERLYN